MTLPAIRPHQKTLLHLRDSATVDFGPAGQTLTNNGVTVADDVFTFSSGDYIDPGTPLADADVDDWTIAAWVKATNTGQNLIYHETPLSTGTQRGVYLRYDTNGTLDCFFNPDGAGAYSTVSGSTDLRDGVWHFVTVRKLGADVEMRLDYDTEVVAQAADSSSYDWTSVDTGTIGEDRRTSQSSPFVGDMADLRVFGYGLTDGELFDLYNEGRGYDLPERKQLPDTRLHLVDGLTDAGFYGTEVTNNEVTYQNGAYTLDGSTAYLTHGELLTSQTFSVSFWFKTASSATMYVWQAMDESPSIGHGSGVQLTGSKVRFFHGDGTAIEWLDKSLTYDDDAWHHVVCTWDGTTQTVYVDDDGSPATRTDGSIVWPAVADLVAGFGRDHRTGRLDKYFAGQLADIRIIETALTAGEVANLYRKGIPALRDAEVLRIDPARYSGSGDLIDQTGNGNDGTLTGSTTVTEDGTISFLSSSGHVETGTSGLSKTSGTYAFWFKSPDASTVNDRQYFFDIQTTRIVFLKDSGTGNSMTFQVDGKSNTETFSGWAADEWNHIAATWDTVADEFKIYFNGVQQGGATGSGTLGSNAVTGTLVIGAAFDGSNTVLGEMDKIVVASEAYTADQIAFLASSREFADPFPEPFLNLGGESLSIQPSRYSGNGDLLDESGNGNDLTLPSGYSVADGVISSDGTANGPTTTVDFTSKSVTASMWLKTTDSQFMIISGDGSRYVGAVNDGSATIQQSGASNRAIYVDGEAVASETGDALHAAICDGTWHHVAITCDTDSPWANARLLENDNASWRYTGEVDDIRLDNTRKYSAEEIKLLASSRGVELPNTRDASIAYSPSLIGDSSAAEVLDLSGNLRHGTPNGVAMFDEDKIVVPSGSANVDIGTPFSNYAAFTVMAFIKSSNAGVDDYYISQRGGESIGWWHLVSRNGLWQFQCRENGGSNNVITSPTATMDAATEFEHVCGVFTGTSVQLWLNGVFIGETAFPGAVPAPTVEASIGSLASGTQESDQEFDMDDVLLFPRVLTPAELSYYAGQRNRFGTAAAETPTPGTWLVDISLFT